MAADVLGMVVADPFPDELLNIEVRIADIELVTLGQIVLVVGLVVSDAGGGPGQGEVSGRLPGGRVKGCAGGGPDLPVGLHSIDVTGVGIVGAAVGMAHTGDAGGSLVLAGIAVGHQRPHRTRKVDERHYVAVPHMAHGLGDRCAAHAVDPGHHLKIGAVQGAQIMGCAEALRLGRRGRDIDFF